MDELFMILFLILSIGGGLLIIGVFIKTLLQIRLLSKDTNKLINCRLHNDVSNENKLEHTSRRILDEDYLQEVKKDDKDSSSEHGM